MARFAIPQTDDVLPEAAQLCNPKEATILAVSDGTWRLFFEFAQDDRSKIGLAAAHSIDGSWEVRPPPFGTRPNSWDVWHLSTGPVCALHPGRPVMFYNGSNREGHWRIGWVRFDKAYSDVLDRGEEPLIVPPAKKRESEDTDIVFAASAVEENGAIRLYYSIADRWLMRAVITRTQ